MIRTIKKRLIHFIPWAIASNFVLLLFLYAICRIIFIFVNRNALSEDFSLENLYSIFYGGIMFDISAICYTNILYLLLVLFPLSIKETHSYMKLVRWVFVAVNSICLIAILMDSIYFQYTHNRATIRIFDEFSGENNLFKIFGYELINHWHLVLIGVTMIYILTRLYRDYKTNITDRKSYYTKQTIWLLVSAFFVVSGIRGAFPKKSTRPIAMNDAFLYVNRPTEASFVINTPFALIRTFGEKPMQTPRYFANSSDMEQLYTPIHYPSDSIVEKKKNVVFLIVESLGQEYVGYLNKNLDNGHYKGYTTFIDSLLQNSLTWEQTFSNSWVSIDALPSILASIPRMGVNYVLSPYSLNRLHGLGTLLGDWGYSTAFFHGAIRVSLGLQAFAKSIGFQQGFSQEDYLADERFGGSKDFDGTWAIWDEPFLQYYCEKMSAMHEPFLTAVFTASSHHPFVIPESYKDVFPDEGMYAMHKCVRYTDNALRRFFRSASKQSWYKNTIFVITADHSLKQFTHDVYKTELGAYRIPIFIFDPSGDMQRGVLPGIAQQIDLMPTLLHYLGYPYPFFAFGKDLLSDKAEDTWAMNWLNFPQYIEGKYVLQFDGKEVSALYDYIEDPMLIHNLKGKIPEEAKMTEKLKAFIQTYMERMKNDNVTY